MRLTIPRARPRALGFTAVELVVVLTVIALMAAGLARWVAVYQRDARGKAIGETLATVHNALEDYGMRYRNQLLSAATSTPQAVTGVAVVTAPTLAELHALGHLQVLVAPTVPRAGTLTLRVGVMPTGCTPPGCALSYLSYLAGPLREFDNDQVAVRVLDAATRAAGGRAGSSEAFAPDRLRGLGGQWDAPNPVPGGVVGILAMVSSSADLGQDAYVRIHDTRDPNLQGNLTVAGTIAGSTLTVTQTAAIGGSLTVASSAAVGATLTAAAVNVAGTLTVGQGGAFGGPVTLGSNLSVAGSVSVTGPVAADRLIPRGSYALLTACPAAEEGAIANRQGGNGMVVCLGGFWRALATQSREGDACAPEGTRATDNADQGLVCVGGAYRGLSRLWRAGTPGQSCAAAGITGLDTANDNETLVCRANPADPSAVLVWYRLRDLTAHLQFLTAVTVIGDGAMVSKPSCSAAATGTAPTPLLKLTPKAYSSDDGGFHVYAENYSASHWVARFRDGTGAVQPGQPSAIAEFYCYYP